MEPSSSLKRLHAVIAEAGFGSRRYAETLIRDGKVRVNGKIIRTQGVKVDPFRNQIEVNGKALHIPQTAKKYYVFYKPVGVVTTLKDPKAKHTIREYFRDIPERLFPAGRLDKSSTGLLLMTNDGELVYRLTHPRFGVEKRYQVTIDRTLSSDTIHTLQKGVILEGRKTASCKIKPVRTKPNGEMELMVVLHEGR
ncbi:MAG: rRNA pseudouridine synthase, partial [Candidatus Omnitrophica bacterium]|nr:rRNA pseudouridine synthase [Candidatus Omnitrophota bacterium]